MAQSPHSDAEASVQPTTPGQISYGATPATRVTEFSEQKYHCSIQGQARASDADSRPAIPPAFILSGVSKDSSSFTGGDPFTTRPSLSAEAPAFVPLRGLQSSMFETPGMPSNQVDQTSSGDVPVLPHGVISRCILVKGVAKYTSQAEVSKLFVDPAFSSPDLLELDDIRTKGIVYAKFDDTRDATAAFNALAIKPLLETFYVAPRLFTQRFDPTNASEVTNFEGQLQIKVLCRLASSIASQEDPTSVADLVAMLLKMRGELRAYTSEGKAVPNLVVRAEFYSLRQANAVMKSLNCLTFLDYGFHASQYAPDLDGGTSLDLNQLPEITPKSTGEGGSVKGAAVPRTLASYVEEFSRLPTDSSGRTDANSIGSSENLARVSLVPALTPPHQAIGGNVIPLNVSKSTAQYAPSLRTARYGSTAHKPSSEPRQADRGLFYEQMAEYHHRAGRGPFEQSLGYHGWDKRGHPQPSPIRLNGGPLYPRAATPFGWSPGLPPLSGRSYSYVPAPVYTPLSTSIRQNLPVSPDSDQLSSPCELKAIRSVKGTAECNSCNNSNNNNNKVNIHRIVLGYDVRTTIMIRNIPNRVTLKELKDLVDKTSKGLYDFLYLRVDFTNNSNVGYGFVNFEDPLGIVPFVMTYEGYRWDGHNSDKIAEVSYATCQGRDSLIAKFRNSSVMLEAPDFRPKLYYTSGPKQGEEEPFPEPDNISKLKRSIDNAEQIGLYAPRAGLSSRQFQRHRTSRFDRGTRSAAADEASFQARGYPQIIPSFPVPPNHNLAMPSHSSS